MDSINAVLQFVLDTVKKLVEWFQGVYHEEIGAHGETKEAHEYVEALTK